jgi:hypothetical protein
VKELKCGGTIMPDLNRHGKIELAASVITD